MSDSEEIRDTLKLPDAMVRDARHLARELMQLTEGVNGASMGLPSPSTKMAPAARGSKPSGHLVCSS